MSEKDQTTPPEVESLNERIIDADELSTDDLEDVSGGDCGSFSCGTYTVVQQEEGIS